jgi:cadmium resistance protein CadD (predicted permease)
VTVEQGRKRLGGERFWRTSCCSAGSRYGKIEFLVNQYLAVLIAGITTFAITNIDDAFLLTVFFARRIPTRRIVAGQYAGFAAIVGLSLIGVWGALALPHRWIRLLGILPLAIAIKRLWEARQTGAVPPTASTESVASIALVTLSNGADNISVYVPFFVIGRSNLWVILIEYAGLVALWCFVGRWLGSHSLILRSADRLGQWAVPLVFAGLGIYVLSS